jgi:hypothetical protein
LRITSLSALESLSIAPHPPTAMSLVVLKSAKFHLRPYPNPNLDWPTLAKGETDTDRLAKDLRARLLMEQ